MNLDAFDAIERVELKGKILKDSKSAVGDYLFDLPWLPIYAAKPDDGAIVSISDSAMRVSGGSEIYYRITGRAADIALAKGTNPITFESAGSAGLAGKLNVMYFPNDAKLFADDLELLVEGRIRAEAGEKCKEDSVVAGAQKDICNSYGNEGRFCTDVVMDAYRNAGINLPEETRNAHKMLLYFKENGKILDKNAAWQKGDVIFWDTTSDWSGPKNGNIHVGVYGGWGHLYLGENKIVYARSVVHASSSALHPSTKTKGHVKGAVLWRDSKKDGRIVGIGRW